MVLIVKLGGSGGSGERPGTAANASGTATPARLTATISSLRLPRPLYGESVASAGSGLLVIGGADRSDASTDEVLLLDPRASTVSPVGTLVAPLHDGAAATRSGRTLVFGGGASTTLDTVQALTPGGAAQQVGRLPAAVSDLSAIEIGDAAYVIGGYDGQAPVASILRTTDGRSFTELASLPTPLRYTAVAAIGDRIYAFGGELGSGADTDQIQEYDIATQRAVGAGHLPESVSHASAVVLGGAIYLLGGRRNGRASDRILRFDPSRKTAVPAGHLPAPVFDGAAGTFSGTAYLVGGINSQGRSVDSIVAVRP